MRAGAWYAAAAAVLALLVGAVGSGMVEAAASRGVWVGALTGLAVQVAGFWLLFVWAFPARHGLAHGLGMLLRFAAVGVMALVWLPRAGVAAAPTLFSLVTVLFLTTLAEPLVLRTESTKAARSRVGDGAALRT